jgi:EAL domain-containing protein (putative c-di-GMP-specific phosphodiesterase class I)
LEITETALMRHPDAAAQRLQSLKSLGVCIALDDFGTGYSSLAYLRQFPVDALKIDRSFISGIAASRESGDALIHTLVQLGKTLGIQTLGEGIEPNPTRPPPTRTMRPRPRIPLRTPARRSRDRNAPQQRRGNPRR